jgi:hypothetical protein
MKLTLPYMYYFLGIQAVDVALPCDGSQENQRGSEMRSLLMYILREGRYAKGRH